MARKTNGAHHGLKLYKAYNFRDKDPVIDEVRTLVEDTYGIRVRVRTKDLNKALQKIEEGGGPTVSCMRAWFFGVTLRPQNPTVEAAGRSMGYQRVWLKMKEK